MSRFARAYVVILNVKGFRLLFLPRTMRFEHAKKCLSKTEVNWIHQAPTKSVFNYTIHCRPSHSTLPHNWPVMGDDFAECLAGSMTKILSL